MTTPAVLRERAVAAATGALGCYKVSLHVGTTTHGGPEQYADGCGAHGRGWPCLAATAAADAVLAALAAPVSPEKEWSCTAVTTTWPGCGRCVECRTALSYGWATWAARRAVAPVSPEEPTTPGVTE